METRFRSILSISRLVFGMTHELIPKTSLPDLNYSHPKPFKCSIKPRFPEAAELAKFEYL